MSSTIKIWENFHDHPWMALNGIDLSFVEDVLNLTFIREAKWFYAASFLWSEPPTLDGYENDTILIVEPMKGLALVFGRALLSFDRTLNLCQELSRFSTRAYTFVQDVHSDYERWSTALNGDIQSIVTRNGEMILIEGNVSDIEQRYFEENPYAFWQFEDLLSELIGIKLSESNLEKLADLEVKMYWTDGLNTMVYKDPKLDRKQICI